MAILNSWTSNDVGDILLEYKMAEMESHDHQCEYEMTEMENHDHQADLDDAPKEE